MFKGRHFDRSVILLCARWYLAYNLSLRNLEEMMAERGIKVDHATIHRWIIRYSPELLNRFNSRKRAVAAKWHVDETTSGSVGGGCISTGPSTAMATLWSSGSANGAT
jgi:transposase-like protein